MNIEVVSKQELDELKTDLTAKFDRLEKQILDALAGKKSPDRKWFSVAQAAERFGVSKKSIYRLIDRGLLETGKAFRHIRIPLSSIEKYERICV